MMRLFRTPRCADYALDSAAETAKNNAMHRRSSVVLALLLPTVACLAAERKVTIRLDAGDFDRRDTPVSFSVESNIKGHRFLKAGDRLFPLQINETNASFFPDPLKRGSQATFEFAVGEPQHKYASSIGATRQNQTVQFTRTEAGRRSGDVMSKPLFTYQAEPGEFPRANIKELFRRGAYLHPIRTLSGKVITDDFPPNHIHHHGIWWAWTNTEFDGRKPDFWNMGDGKGRVDFVTLERHWSGPVHAGFSSRHRFVDLTGPKQVEVLTETWTVTAYAQADSQRRWWLFDLVSEQRCATTNTLKLPENLYGGLGLRGSWAWNGATNMNFLTSEGETDRVKGNKQRGRWCDMWGLLDGEPAGIAVLCHPSNFRFPQPMRLHPTEPFFNFAPQQAGDMAIKPGETYVSRYRFIVHDGEMTKSEIDRLWNDYAQPPVVKVSVQ
ncbi:MAG TPA: PmoA family protein [Verrucomicrobiae bacterium]|nr:PmoA family protein [Verrucomicrobiae bacterium]